MEEALARLALPTFRGLPYSIVPAVLFLETLRVLVFFSSFLFFSRVCWLKECLHQGSLHDCHIYHNFRLESLFLESTARLKHVLCIFPYSVSVWICVSVSVSEWMCVYVFFMSVCHYVFLSVCVCLCVTVWVCMCICVSLDESTSENIVLSILRNYERFLYIPFDF